MIQLLYISFVAINFSIVVLILTRRTGERLDPLRWLLFGLASFVGSILGLLLSTVFETEPGLASYIIDFLLSAFFSLGSLGLLLRLNR